MPYFLGNKTNPVHLARKQVYTDFEKMKSWGNVDAAFISGLKAGVCQYDGFHCDGTYDAIKAGPIVNFLKMGDVHTSLSRWQDACNNFLFVNFFTF